MESLATETGLSIPNWGDKSSDSFSLLYGLFQTLRDILVKEGEETSQGATKSLALYSQDMPRHFSLLGNYKSIPFEFRVSINYETVRIVCLTHGHFDLTRHFFAEVNRLYV